MDANLCRMARFQPPDTNIRIFSAPTIIQHPKTAKDVKNFK